MQPCCTPAQDSAVGTEKGVTPRPVLFAVFALFIVILVLDVNPYREYPGVTEETKYVPMPPFPVKKSVITTPAVVLFSVIVVFEAL
jgi:hypothetical protein